MTGDRRRDDRTREVLRNVENDWQAAIRQVRGEYAGLARLLRRVGWLLIGSTLTLALAVGGAFYVQDRDRKRAVISSCQERNSLSEANIGFVVRIAPELEQQARRTFPIEPDCEAYATRLGY